MLEKGPVVRKGVDTETNINNFYYESQVNMLVNKWSQVRNLEKKWVPSKLMCDIFESCATVDICFRISQLYPQ